MSRGIVVASKREGVHSEYSRRERKKINTAGPRQFELSVPVASNSVRRESLFVVERIGKDRKIENADAHGYGFPENTNLGSSSFICPTYCSRELSASAKLKSAT